MNKQSGTTLVEVMLAGSLSLFLLLGLMQVYVTVKKNLARQEAILQIQENSRFAEHILRHDLRQAGYAGCEGMPVNQDLAIQGYQENLPSFLQGKVRENTDSLVLGLCRYKNARWQFEQYAYFIGPTARVNSLGEIVYALYGQAATGDKEELVANITAMKISYGLTKPGSQEVENYVSSREVTDWSQVRSVDLSLALISDKPVYSVAQSYEFRQTKMPADRYLHREWEMYVALRERL